MSTTIVRMNPKTLPDAGKAGYSQISVADPGRLAFVSGQVAWPVDGGEVPDTLADQAVLVTKNLQSVLSAVGSTPQDIVQMRIYMTDLRPETQDIVMPPLSAFLDGVQPSITAVGVTALATPELQIEIEMVVQVAS